MSAGICSTSGEKAMSISSEANKVKEIAEEGQNVSNSVNVSTITLSEVFNMLILDPML